ncbi:tripartite tricarboxylate transporter TctB family protein [Candidatus Thioglobus sp.]|nr:tripartite tricarboxylate transporter TctB family protein [Candidatus Thioglobus sp.]|tara:strand:+ start:2115 stop:2546 length:432 start_codon:yes stop_codon:yes gene_type:complete
MNKQIKISTVIVTLISVFLVYASFVLGNLEDYLFPRLISVMIALLSLMLWFEKGEADKSTNFKDLMPGIAIATAFILLLKILGFYLASMIVFFTLVMYYSKPIESKDFWRVLLTKLGVTIVFTLTLYGLFTLLLQVRTPEGLF